MSKFGSSTVKSLFNYSLRSKKNSDQLETNNSVDSIEVDAEVHNTPQSQIQSSTKVPVVQRLFKTDVTTTPTTSRMTNHGSSRLKLSNLMQMIHPLKPKRMGYELFSENCERVLALADANGVNKDALISQIINYISESGCDFTVNHTLTTWQEIKKICDENFLKRKSEPQILLKMTSLKQGKLNVFKYYNEFARLLKQYGDLKVIEYSSPEEEEHLEMAMAQINKIAMGAFINGLEPDIKKSLVHAEPKSLKEAYDLAKKYEDKMIDDDDDDEDDVQKTLQKILKLVDEPKFHKPQINMTEVVVCQLCAGNHSAKSCPTDSMKPSVVCQICNKTNHSAQNCFQRGQNNVNRSFRGNGNRFNNNNRNVRFSNNNSQFDNRGAPPFNQNNNYSGNRNYQYAQPGPSNRS